MKETVQKPRRGRPKTLDKAKVTEVAMKAYWEDGPAEVSLNAVCQRAGVSKPSVYREFGNEDGLTHAALENYANCVLAQILDILQGEQPLADKIKQVAYIAAEDATHKNGCLFVKMRAVKARMGDNTQSLISAIENIAVDAYAKALDEGRRSGAWQSDIPIPLAAQYLHAQIGLALEQRSRGEDPTAILSLALSVLGHTGDENSTTPGT